MQNPINRSLFVLVTLLLLGMVFIISPAQIPVIIFKASLVSLAAILGYWIDYLLFPHMRPGVIDKIEKDPIIDDREEYLKIKNIIPQVITKTKPNSMFIENKIPT